MGNLSAIPGNTGRIRLAFRFQLLYYELGRAYFHYRPAAASLVTARFRLFSIISMTYIETRREMMPRGGEPGDDFR